VREQIADDPQDLGDVALVLAQPIERDTLPRLITALFGAAFQSGEPRRLVVEAERQTWTLLRSDGATQRRLAVARLAIDTYLQGELVTRIVRRAGSPLDARRAAVGRLRLALLAQDVTPGPHHSMRVASWNETAVLRIACVEADLWSLLPPSGDATFIRELSGPLRVSAEKLELRVWPERTLDAQR
jgi:hypothetical protein